MINNDEYHLALVTSVVSELRKKPKIWLALHLANSLVVRHIKRNAEASQIAKIEEPAKTAARLVHALFRSDASLISQDGASNLANPRTNADEVAKAKAAIKLHFNAWYSAKPSGRWHASFAQTMIRRYSCIDQETIEEWARTWDNDAKRRSWRNRLPIGPVHHDQRLRR
jgi:hypothetical protein